MKKFRYPSSLLMLVGIALSALMMSCFEERDLTYRGPSVVEFKNYYLEAQSRLGLANFQVAYPHVVPAENLGLTAITVRQGAYRDSVLVQLVGPQQPTAIEIPFTISQSSSAVEGVHFNFAVNPSGRLKINANASSGYIYLDILNGLGATDPDRVVLEINLNPNQPIQPSENYKTFTYNIIK